MIRVLVTGGRDYDNDVVVFRELDRLHDTQGIAVVIHGACSEMRDGKRVLRGADRWADEWAKSRGADVIPCPADWTRHGKFAGPLRNAVMLRDHAPDLVLAFPGGRGTADMVWRARKADVPVVEVGP